MPSKPKDVSRSNISPVLFMTVDGKPMSFYLRPGPTKCKLQPLITAGGGILCSVQQPGAILLMEPEDKGSIAENTSRWFVSTEYIYDCIEKDEQLDVAYYMLIPEAAPKQSARPNNNKESSPGLLGGRIPYTAEEDDAILTYVSKHKADIGGNRLWQEMEKQRVTSHSWQSMKYRYRVRLAKKQSADAEEETAEEDSTATEGETKVEGNQETDVENPSRPKDAVCPQTHLTESDLTQIDDPSIPAERTQSKLVEAQTSTCLQGEEEHVNSQTQKQPAESIQGETIEAETSNSPQPEGPCLDTETDAHSVSAESTKPETDEPQTTVSPQKESVPTDSSPAQPVSMPSTSSQKKSNEEPRASPRLQQQQRRSTRRQLQLEESLAEPYGKKLRSLANSGKQSSSSSSSSSPQPLRKTKSAGKSALQRDTTDNEPPSKRAKGTSVAAVEEGQQEESEQATISETTRETVRETPQKATRETTQADTESDSAPQKGGKKKQKRKFGILEWATKEFEDDSECDEDEAPDLQNPTETVTTQPTSTEPPPSTSDTAVSAQSNPERGPGLQDNVQETQASSENCPTETTGAEPAAAEAVSATSKAHLFIFESESQEEESQSIISDRTVAPANPLPTMDKDAAFSLTQVQLEEDKQQIKELMEKTNQDLVSVTKALLKTSGDFSAALDLLSDPSSFSGPLWKRCDDTLLCSADPAVRQQLQEEFGEEEVAKRILFLEVEG
ncbi:telomeric repeat-binding factor 2-interacting protein 1 [Larimichthys crocea]|uniref:telomeric repeat-binding factor 2-interacting protein 1 n=1 Tax=Larimichthys crocea TaxID=215358 RepID=UPI000F5E8EFE|nr:telomeric repeat-binding factor 2-interacting protein 1 [Larimichthys crocea]